MTRICYLAGPLFGCSLRESTGWRQEAKALLGAENVADPTDWALVPDEAVLSKGDCDRLVESDLNRLDKCDAMIWNCWKPSCGSAMEAYHAHVSMLVVVIRNGPCPAWVRHVADHVVSSVSEACRLVANHLQIGDAPCLK